MPPTQLMVVVPEIRACQKPQGNLFKQYGNSSVLPLCCCWGYRSFQAGCRVSAMLLWKYQLPGYPLHYMALTYPEISCREHTSHICWLVRGFATNTGWRSRDWGCELVCREGGSTSNMSLQSRDLSCCVDGKCLSLEGTTSFVLLLCPG